MGALGLGVRVWISPIEACISDFVCVAICPEVFEIDERSGKVAVNQAYRTSPEEKLEGVADESLTECIKVASENCPVDIIHWELQG